MYLWILVILEILTDSLKLEPRNSNKTNGMPLSLKVIVPLLKSPPIPYSYPYSKLS
jgi:hypothetical protein